MRKIGCFFKQAVSVAVATAVIVGTGGLPVTNYAKAEGVKYVVMNVPYTDFYRAMGMEENYYDAVSTATTTKFKGTDGLAKGTYNDGTDILGVTYPVALSETDYQAMSQSQKTEGESYYFKDYEGTPASYMTMTSNEGKYSFSADTVKENSADGLSVGNFSTTSSYGDYQIDLVGVLPQGANEEPGAVIGELMNLSISGVILTTDDGKSYGMGMLENIWVGTRVQNVEVAWSVPEGNGLSNHGGVKFKTFDTNGKTLKEVKVITDQGIYTIACEQKLTPYYTGGETVTAEIADATTLNISVPADFQDAKVTVSYRQERTTIYVAENASITDGKVALEGVPETETQYTVTVSSSNYAAKSVNVTYGTSASDEGTGITDDQKTKLNEYITTGTALVEANPALTLLASHIQEAKELLNKQDATSAEAQELIGELGELIEEAQKNANDADNPGNTDTEPGNEPEDTKTAQSITNAVTSKKIAYKKLKKAAVSFSIGAKANGKVTYKKISGNKKITVSAAGKVKIAKGLKKGTYNVKVKITAKATTNYNAATQTKTIKITIK